VIVRVGRRLCHYAIASRTMWAMIHHATYVPLVVAAATFFWLLVWHLTDKCVVIGTIGLCAGAL
jgi:hypothetical protein